jgi:hypothetical protein
MSKSLDMLKGLKVRLYLYASELRIRDYEDIKDPSKTMSKLSTYKFTLPTNITENTLAPAWYEVVAVTK